MSNDKVMWFEKASLTEHTHGDKRTDLYTSRNINEIKLKKTSEDRMRNTNSTGVECACMRARVEYVPDAVSSWH